MRLFIALELDEATRDAIGQEQRRLGRALGHDASIRWVAPHQLHLTLVFLGNVDESRAGRLCAALSTDCQTPRFPVLFAGLGLFPASGLPRVVWLGSREGTERLQQLEREIAGRVREAGIDLESRPFHPHLTLGRWRHSRAADRTRILSCDRSVPIAGVWVEQVTLFQSHLSPAGSSYTALARATLRP
jgi:RNA 2',3'-cyclic 3'-phosphodiesterase